MFHFSIKKGREIEKLATELEQEFVRFSALQTIHWLASQFRAVEKEYHTYAVLCAYLARAGEAPDKREEDKARVKGIYARVTSLKHVLFLVFLMDFLPPLKTGSLHFQDEDMFLPVVMRKLKELKHSLIGLKGGNGVHMRQFVAEFNDDIWKGMKLNRTAGLGPVTRQRFASTQN